MNKMILKFMWNGKRPRIIATTILKTNKKNPGGLTFFYFKIFCKETVSPDREVLYEGG